MEYEKLAKVYLLFYDPLYTPSFKFFNAIELLYEELS